MKLSVLLKCQVMMTLKNIFSYNSIGPALPRGSLRGAFGGHHHNQQQQHTWKKEQNMHCVRKRTKRGYDIDFTFMASKNRDPFKDPFEIELYFNKHALPPQLQHKIRMIQELNSIIFRRRWEVSGGTIEGATKSVRCLQFSEYRPRFPP